MLRKLQEFDLVPLASCRSQARVDHLALGDRASLEGIVERLLAGLVFIFGALFASSNGVVGQNPTGQQGIDVSFEEVDPAIIVRLDNYISSRQYSDALEVIDELVIRHRDKWIRVDQIDLSHGTVSRWFPTIEFVLWKLAKAPTDLQTRYRRTADALVRRQLESIDMNRSSSHYSLVRAALASSLGEELAYQHALVELERGNFSRARDWVDRIHGGFRVTEETDDNDPRLRPFTPIWLAWLQLESEERSEELAQEWLSQETDSYPVSISDHSRETAELLALLCWISIQEKHWERAEQELNLIEVCYPQAVGQITGQEGAWVELLRSRLTSAKAAWTEQQSTTNAIPQWGTLGGDLSRNQFAVGVVDPPGVPTWSIRLTPQPTNSDVLSERLARFHEPGGSALAFHPIVVNGHVYWVDGNRLCGAELESGRPLWAEATSDDDPNQFTLFEWIDRQSFADRRRDRVGTPRMTLSTHRSFLFARVGTPITGSHDSRFEETSALVGLNLEQEGRLLSGFPLQNVLSHWSFDGCPISDGRSLFGIEKRTSLDTARVTLSIASYDLSKTDRDERRQLRWRTKLADCEVHTFGIWDQQTHNLLTLDEGVLFVNTNAGVVAAIDGESGEPLWVVEYPRTRMDDEGAASNYFRDLTPCVVEGDQVFVLPTDSRSLFALDRSSGLHQWQVEIPDGLAILGVNQRHVFIGGSSLMWIDRRTGTLQSEFPRSGSPTHRDSLRLSPRGYGRGVVTPKRIYWPTRDAIFVFDTDLQSNSGSDGRTWYQPRCERMIDLSTRGVTGGNLTIVGRWMLIAGADQLWAFETVSD